MKQRASYTVYRFLLSACVPMLLLGGCREDDESILPTDGGRVEITNIQTRNSEDGTVAFGKDGAVLNVKLTYKDVAQSGVLEYGSSSWKWKDDKPLYWQSTTENHKLLICYSPVPEGSSSTANGGIMNFSLPANEGWTNANWNSYDFLSKTLDVTPATLPASIGLEHCMAMAKVILVAGEGCYNGELPEVTGISMTLPTEGSFNPGSGKVTRQAGKSDKKSFRFYRPDPAKAEFYALALPGETGTKVIEIESNGTKYRYTAEAGITFTAGKCNTYTLALNKAGVAPLGISVEGWAAGSAISGTAVDAPSGSEIILNDGLTLPTVTGSKKYSTFTIYGSTISDATKNFITTYKANNGITLNIYTNKIPEACFQHSDNTSDYIKKVYIGSSTYEIGKFAFSKVTTLTDVGISVNGGCMTMGYMAFEGTKIKTVMIPARVTWGTKKTFIDNDLNSPGDGARGYYLLNCAFNDCTDLETVTFAEGLTSLGTKMFDGCTKLKKLTIPYSVKQLDFTFYGNEALTEIDAPGVEQVGEYTFWNTGITYINLPSCRRLGKSAFARTQSLKKIKLPCEANVQNLFLHSTVTTAVLGEDVTTVPQFLLPEKKDAKLAIHGGNAITIHSYLFKEKITLFLYGVTDKKRAEYIRDLKNNRADSWAAVYYKYTGSGGYDDPIDDLTNPGKYTKLEDPPATP